MCRRWRCVVRLWPSRGEDASVLPDSFLGGSAPRLVLRLDFWGIRFCVPVALSISTGVGQLEDPGRVPKPETTFPWIPISSRSGWLGKPTATSTHTRCPPALTSLLFQGDCEYLEGAVSRIDAPLLDSSTMTFFNQLIFDTPSLRHFITRIAIEAPHRANVFFSDDRVNVTLIGRKGTDDREILQFGVSCRASDWQLSSLSQVCNSSLPPFVTLERLGIYSPRQNWQDDMENEQWLELLHPFTSEGSGSMPQALGSVYLSRLARTHRGKGNGSVTRVTKPFLRGATATGTCQGSDSGVRCRATALISSRGPPLVMRGLVVNVLKLGRSVIDERALLSVRLLFHTFYLFLVLGSTHHPPFSPYPCCSALGV